ncbi:uncharacterized protein LOC125522488 [Triticum urartu]|uniref:uncharacterized protein LOC125522488 n=1 Tax=Triticum urartu TaxID=4572 RepID=UPI0020440CA5|nr:uncharacterized protein LOC125522488 [Triticum urartu]
MGGPPHADPPAPFAAPPFLRSRGSHRAAAPPFLPLRSPREPPRPSPPSHSSCSIHRGSRRALRRPVAWWSEGFDWKHQHDPGESQLSTTSPTDLVTNLVVEIFLHMRERRRTKRHCGYIYEDPTEEAKGGMPTTRGCS